MHGLNDTLFRSIIRETGAHAARFEDDSVAHLVIHEDQVIASKPVNGLSIKTNHVDDGIEIYFTIKEGVVIQDHVQICFGILPENGKQKIVLHVKVEDNASVNVVAHCVFPNAVKVEHIMDADIVLGKNAYYSYLEKHVHGKEGGIRVIPKARISLDECARFKTEFELLTGRVGYINIDYEAQCGKKSIMDMTARINGIKNDKIEINEKGILSGESSKGVLTSRIALRDNASACVNNTLIATSPYARGHVDCKEIVQDNASASAIPIVEVRHPQAHISHEAAIGSVDNKELETLMSRGLNEDDAVSVIINGLLR